MYPLPTKQKSVELWRSCQCYGNGTINILCASAWCVATYFDFPLMHILGVLLDRHCHAIHYISAISLHALITPMHVAVGTSLLRK